MRSRSVGGGVDMYSDSVVRMFALSICKKKTNSAMKCHRSHGQLGLKIDCLPKPDIYM